MNGSGRPGPERTFAPWRRALLAPTALIAALVAGCGGSGSSGPGSGSTAHHVTTASGTAAASAGTTAGRTTTFTSKRFGYSVVVPGGSARWLAVRASEDWSGQVTSPNSPSIDTFTDEQSGRLYLIASLPQPAGTTLDEFVREVLRARPGSCHTKTSFSDSTLAGVSARVARFSCTDGYAVTQLAALHGGRGYFLIVASQTTGPRAEHRSAFEAVRRSFRYSS